MKTCSIFLSAALLCFGCGDYMPGGSVKPDDAFRLFAGLTAPAPVPAGVNNLQAGGAIWMDFTVCCRFSATKEIIDSIINNGYEEVQWETIQPDMSPKPYIDDFSPKWNPAGLKQKECYTKRVELDDAMDTLHLVVDWQQGIVYAVGNGSVPNRQSTTPQGSPR